MSNSMGKEELLEWLDLFHCDYQDWNPGDIEGGKGAHTQLVKIVEQHFSEPKKAAVKLMAVNTVVKMINAMPEEERTELKAKMFPDTQAEQSGEVDVKLKQVLALVADTIYTLRKDFFPDKTAGRMVGSLDKAVPIIKQLLQQKRTVTREWLEEYCKADGIDKEEMRKELGIEVVEK